MWLDDGVYLGWFAVELGFRQRCVLANLLFSVFFAAVMNTRLQKCVTFGELLGGAGCLGGVAGKRLDGLPLLYFPTCTFPGVGGVPVALYYRRRRFRMHSSGTRGRARVVFNTVPIF